MFEAILLSRYPLKMATFLRQKQTGVQSDLSAGIRPELFVLDDVSDLPFPAKLRK